MWFIVARLRRSPASGKWHPEAVSGGSHTALRSRDDEPHHPFDRALPRTARNRPHGSGSLGCGIKRRLSCVFWPMLGT